MNRDVRRMALAIADALPWWLYLIAGIVGTIGMLAIVYRHGTGR